MSESKHPKIHRTLNQKERMFVDAYCGDVLEAVTLSGYSGGDSYLRAKGRKLLADPAIMEAIKDRSRYLNKTKNIIASRDERMEMWTNIMTNSDPHYKEEKDAHGIKLAEPNIPMNMRLKASELLGKAEGDFIDRVDFSGKITISDVIMKSYEVQDKSLEDIEAEYMIIREQKRLDKKKDQELQSQIDYEDKPEDIPISLEDLI